MPLLAQRGRCRRCRRCTNVRVCTGITKSEPELQGVAKRGPGVTAVPARKGGWWVAVTAARVRTSYHKKLLVLQSSGIQRRRVRLAALLLTPREAVYPAIRRRSRPGVGGTTGTGGYRTGRVQLQDDGVLQGRLALEEAGAAHESRHGVVDHRRGYARGQRSVG